MSATVHLGLTAVEWRFINMAMLPPADSASTGASGAENRGETPVVARIIAPPGGR